MFFSIMLACWLLMQGSHQLKWCRTGELPKHMQDICTTIDEIDINLKPGQRNVNVGNKNLKLVKRSSSTTAKKMILLGRATKNTNKRENEKRSQSLIKKCKDNKFRCVRAILTIAREKGKVQAKLGKEIKFKDNRKNLQMKLHR